jgi:hypothetical protein
MKKSSGLNYSWNLIEKIKEMNPGGELGRQIFIYIEQNKGSKGISNIFFRSNLHYIIDNIDRNTLLSELTKVNNKNKQTKN